MQRMTKQRQAVLDELTRVTDFRSAQQIFEDLHSQGHRVGLATVYRSLQGLAEDGRVDTLRSSDGESLYRSCTSNHHHPPPGVSRVRLHRRNRAVSDRVVGDQRRRGLTDRGRRAFPGTLRHLFLVPGQGRHALGVPRRQQGIPSTLIDRLG